MVSCILVGRLPASWILIDSLVMYCYLNYHIDIIPMLFPFWLVMKSYQIPLRTLNAMKKTIQSHQTQMQPLLNTP